MHLSHRAFLASGPLEAGGPAVRSPFQACGAALQKAPESQATVGGGRAFFALPSPRLLGHTQLSSGLVMSVQGPHLRGGCSSQDSTWEGE